MDGKVAYMGKSGSRRPLWLAAIGALLLASGCASVPAEGMSLTDSAPAVPEIPRSDDGELIVATPGGAWIRTYVLKVELSAFDRTLAALPGAMQDEPIEVRATSAEQGEITIATTEWGAMRLTTRALNRNLEGLTAVQPPVDRIAHASCSRIFVNFDHGAEGHEEDELFAPVACPPAMRFRPEESLVIAGVDAEGNELWVTAVADPRPEYFEDFEAEGGPSRVTRMRENSEMSVILIVPVTPALARLRWFEAGSGNGLVLIGESDWRPAAAEANDD